MDEAPGIRQEGQSIIWCYGLSCQRLSLSYKAGLISVQSKMFRVKQSNVYKASSITAQIA